MQLIRVGNPFAINLAFAMLVVVLTFIALLNAEVIATHGNVSPINLTGLPDHDNRAKLCIWRIRRFLQSRFLRKKQS
jgi:hypothetical protein